MTQEGSVGDCQWRCGRKLRKLPSIRLESDCTSFATGLQPAEETHGGRARFRRAVVHSERVA